MKQKVIDRAIEIIQQKTGGGNDGYCTLALIDEDGYPTTSTISISKADGIHTLTMCTGLGSNKVKRINQCDRASICFNDDSYHISLVGTVKVVTDANIKKEMWYDGLSGHFKGPEDPNYCVLVFTTKRYNLFVDWQEAIGSL